MDIGIYLEHAGTVKEETTRDFFQDKKLGGRIMTSPLEGQVPDYENADLALIGVPEDRNAVNNEGCARAPERIRNHLYNLFTIGNNIKIADMGNLRRGHTPEDTYFALSAVVSELIRNNTVPIIIGGSQDLTFANYMAYESLGQIINIVSIDSLFDLGMVESEINSRSFLSQIILHQPNYLFNFTNIGYQSYFVDAEAVELMKNLYFDVYRLGRVKEKLEEVEPIVRNADMLSFDISSVRHSDAPGNGNASPNGFYGEEVCQIMRYAGLSDKLTSIGFYETNPQFDHNDQTSHLVAQMIWYFIDGFYNRKHEYPGRNRDEFIKYTVSIKNHKDQIVFFKSKRSDRWWMDVPVKTNLRTIYERHHLIPCSYSDYEVACKDDIPDRWWQAYQKLM
ncbi:MAG: formimidoylglutamase [Bacteroidales bacterium]|nr:formimidoylglutamase [Bacteroidales bacterium]